MRDVFFWIFVPSNEIPSYTLGDWCILIYQCECNVTPITINYVNSCEKYYVPSIIVFLILLLHDLFTFFQTALLVLKFTIERFLFLKFEISVIIA